MDDKKIDNPIDVARQVTQRVNESKKVEETTPNKEEEVEAVPQTDPVDGEEQQKPLDAEDDRPLSEVLNQQEESEEEEESDSEDEEDEEDEDEETVPKATFLKVKKKLKDEIRSLKKRKDPSSGDYEDIANEIADEYNVDPAVISRIMGETMSLSEKRMKEKIDALEKNQRTKELESKKEQAFETLFSQMVSKNPGIDAYINKEFIKKQALSSENANKSLKQIVDEIYGGALSETKKVESFDDYSPNKGNDEPEDYTNPSVEEMKRIKKNPAMREKFTQNLIKKINW